MKDGTLPFQVVLRQALVASSAVTALVGQRIYDDAPAADANDAATLMPYLLFGVPQVLHFGNDGYRGCAVHFSLHSWAQADEDGRSHLTKAKQINAAVIDALWGDTVASPSGWELHRVWIDREGSRVLRDPDGVTAHGIVSVRGDMTPII